MDDFTAQSVKEVFGTDFQQYCLRQNILLKKDECGAFIVPNINILIECMEVLDGFKYETDLKLRQLQKDTLPTNRFSHEYYLPRLEELRESKRRKRIQFREETIYFNVFLLHMDLTISLFNTPTSLPSYKSKVRTNCALNCRSGSEIYDYIIKETIKGVVINDEYEYSIPLICPLLEELKSKHKKFHYFAVLKYLIRKQKSDKNSKCKYGINKKQLKLFFNLIFGNVVPVAIFGKRNNFKKIKKAMFYLLDTPCHKPFDLRPIIESLDLFSIRWLADIGSTKTKWLILAKFIRWFFIGFLLKMLYTHCHVTLASGHSYERLYILRSTWNFIQRKFIRKGRHSNFFQPDVKCDEWCPPVGTYKLLPKRVGVRPIFRSEYQDTDKNHLYLILKFLKQLYITKYGVTNFQDKWKSIVQKKYNSKRKRSYFVRCDVVNAFGSIIQEKLYNIIQLLCKDLPETLVLKYYVVKSEVYKDDVVCYKQYFSGPHLQLPLTPGTLYTHTNHNQCQWINKNWLLDKISKYIFYQRVKVSQKTHIIGRGIVQGTMISPILSDIYYNFILNKEMSSYLKAGEVIKYMDDILYVTGNKYVAKQFLQLIKRGIPEYNCYFKKSKTQSNISYEQSAVTEEITYIGYKINCRTLEIVPAHSNTSLYYLMSFANKDKLPALEILSDRLNNVACLRLSKFILDNTINTRSVIKEIIKNLSLLQARRACILIKELFHDVEMNLRRIINIITSSNEKIARHIIKMFLINDRKTDQSRIPIWNEKIMRTLWITYRKVFVKDQTLQQYFITVF